MVGMTLTSGRKSPTETRKIGKPKGCVNCDEGEKVSVAEYFSLLPPLRRPDPG
jgi:hypothetical protein